MKTKTKEWCKHCKSKILSKGKTNTFNRNKLELKHYVSTNDLWTNCDSWTWANSQIIYDITCDNWQRQKTHHCIWEKREKYENNLQLICSYLSLMPLVMLLLTSFKVLERARGYGFVKRYGGSNQSMSDLQHQSQRQGEILWSLRNHLLLQLQGIL